MHFRQIRNLFIYRYETLIKSDLGDAHVRVDKLLACILAWWVVKCASTSSYSGGITTSLNAGIWYSQLNIHGFALTYADCVIIPRDQKGNRIVIIIIIIIIICEIL